MDNSEEPKSSYCPLSNSQSEEEEISSASETEFSDKKNEQPYGDQNLDSSLSKKQKLGDYSEGDDKTQTQTQSTIFIPQAEPGDSSEGAKQEEVQPGASGEDVESPWDPDFTLVLHDEDDEDDGDDWPEDNGDDWPEDIFLFEMQVPVNNILTIPAKIAAEYFPTLSANVIDPEMEQMLQLTDFAEQEWAMPLTYNREENTFTNTNKWREISYMHVLDDSYKILFYRPVPRLHDAHYLIEFDRIEDFEVPIPEFRIKDFLFQIKLEQGDIGFARVFLPFTKVSFHFPAIRLPERSQKKLPVKFTDAQGKNWYMEIIRYNARSYMIIKGWDEFVKQHNLKAMDVIRFYKPEYPSQRKHFLIEIVKQDGGASQNQPHGGDGADRGGASTSGSYKGKGKEITEG